jgi:hypothetical protein
VAVVNEERNFGFLVDDSGTRRHFRLSGVKVRRGQRVRFIPLEADKGRSSHQGAFSLSGPVTYLAGSCAELEELLAANYPAPTTWFHGTMREAAISACWQGLVPSCWCDGDTCCVFGVDSLDMVGPHHDWVLEINSPAIPGQLKAWWVPPHAIRGAWHRGLFLPAAMLREMGTPLLRPAGCSCELAAKTAEEIGEWSRMLASRSARQRVSSEPV